VVFQVSVDVKMADFRDLVKQAAQQTAKVIEQRGRADISGKIQHSSRIKLTTRVRSISRGYVIQEFIKPGFAKVWEYGGVSVGKPLLWLPAGNNRLTKRKYRGKLYRPKGKNVLIGVTSRVKIRGMAGTGLGKSEVKFVGVRSVTHHRRFKLRQIAIEEANNFVRHMGPAIRKR
jgi:hypothetical protein